MPTVDTNIVEVIAALEDPLTWGTAADPPYQQLRITSTALVPDKDTRISNVLRTDRMIDSAVRVALGANGTLPIEPAFGSDFELFFPGLMQNALSSADTSDNETIGSANDFPTAGITQLTWTGNNFTTAGFIVGAYARIFGFAAGDGIYKINAVGTTTLDLVDPGDAIGAGGTGDERVIQKSIKNGSDQTEMKSYTLQERHVSTDGVNEMFVQYTGMRAAQLQLQLTASEIATATWTFEGKDGTPSASNLDDTPTSTPSTQSLSASTDVPTITEGGSAIANVRELTIQINDNPRRKPVIGSEFPIDVGYGRCEVTGTIRAYHDATTTLMNKVRNHTASSFGVTFQDVDGNIMRIEVPRLRYGTGRIEVSGVNDDAFFVGEYITERDPVTNSVIQFDFLANTP
jgi:hypothetical protein